MERGDTMPYRIEYGPTISKQPIQKRNPLRLQAMTAVMLLLFSLTVHHFFPSGIEKLRSILLPSTPGITQEALDTFMCDLRGGESLGDSFTAFCSYIIDHDEILSG